MKPGRVLVTGAGGFVGRALAEGFVDLGWDVVGLDRAFDADCEPARFQCVERDLARGVDDQLPRFDVVIHAAWVTTDPTTLGVSPTEHVLLNLRPLLGILEYVDRTAPSAFVFLSSSGVFGPNDGSDGLRDSDTPTGDSYYAAAKRAGELLVQASSGPRVPTHVMRLGYLFGPGEVSRTSRRGVSLVATWLDAALDGSPLAVRQDDPVRDWTFTSDLAEALLCVLDDPPAGRPLHLGSPQVLSDNALAASIADLFDGASVTSAPAVAPVKPPMVPSDIPALHGFSWTPTATALHAMVTSGAMT